MARVLVVDDDSDIVTLLTTLLEGEGHRAKAAIGEAVLPVAIEWQPDVIFLDLMMPDLDGFAINRALRGEGRTKALNIVAMSAGYMLSEHGHNLDVNGFMPKPFDLIDVLTWVEKLGSKPRLAVTNAHCPCSGMGGASGGDLHAP